MTHEGARPPARGLLLLGLSLTTIVLTLLTLEIFLRLSGLQPPFLYQWDPEVCASHIAGLQTTLTTPEYSARVSFNSAGFRDRERSIEKPAGTFRIAILGDSFIEALQVADEQTAAQVLERELRERLAGRDVEVLNFGCAGFGTTCSYLTLHHRALAYRPDLVVLAFYPGNDLHDNHPNLALEPNTPFYVMAPDGSLAFRPRVVRDGPMKRWLRAHLRAYLFVRDRLKRIALIRRLGQELGATQVQATPDEAARRRLAKREHSVFMEPPTPELKEAWTITERILDKAAREVGDAGVSLAVLFIPTPEQFDAEALASYRAASPSPSRQAFDLTLPNRRLAVILERLECPMVDLLEPFRASGLPARDLYFTQDGHWTAEGNQRAGRILADAVVKMLEQGPT